jgi:hypothetical protein
MHCLRPKKHLSFDRTVKYARKRLLHAALIKASFAETYKRTAEKTVEYRVNIMAVNLIVCTGFVL